MPPFWHGLNFVKLVDGQDEIAFGILRRASNVPVLVRSLISISAVPGTGFTVLASLSM